MPVKVLNIKVFKLCNQFELSYPAHANKALNGVTKLRVLNSEKPFLLSNFFFEYNFSKTKWPIIVYTTIFTFYIDINLQKFAIIIYF